MSKGFVFVCLLASLSWCAVDAVDYTFSVTSVDDTADEIDCGKNKNEDNPVNLTILEGQSLKLIAKVEKTLAKIYKCERINHKKAIVKRNKKDLRETLNVMVNTDMGGTWNCSVLSHEDIGQIKPLFHLGKTVFSIAHCFLQIHVRRATTPQTVLVNNMILATTQSSVIESNYDHKAIYYYSEGDFVNVSCIINPILSVIKSLSFSYDYAENFQVSEDTQNKYNLPKTLMDKSKTLGYAFRTTLGAEHDKSVMICKCYDKDDYTTVHITFVKQQSDDTSLAVNSHIARKYENMPLNDDSIPVYSYMFFENENVNIQCSVGVQSYLEVIPSFCKDSNQKEIPCYECNGKKYIYNMIKMDSTFKESKGLNINLPKNNIVLEIYDYKDEYFEDHFSWTYYRYDESDKLELNISKPAAADPPMEITCKLHNTASNLNSSTSYLLFYTTLTSDYDKSVLNCTLIDASPSKTIYKMSYVQFLMNERTTTTPSTTTVKLNIASFETTTSTQENHGPNESGFLDWMIPVVAVLMIIVIIIVILVIYRMRKRNQTRETDRNEILQSPSESSIPPYPPQWTATEEQNYHVPVDLRKDNDVYAVPINAKETPYAVPIPKSKRKDKGNYDLLYAELNLGPKAGNSKTNEPTYSNNEPTYAALNVPIGKNSNNEEPAYAAVTDLYSHVEPKDKRKNQGNTELYSQVLPKGARKNNKNEYGNVFSDSPYANSSGAEYVEPTYIEAPRK